MHEEAFSFIRSEVKDKSFDRVLEFGSLNINGSVRDLFTCDFYWGIDLQEGSSVDEVANAAYYRWYRNHPQAFDVVVCCEVLEHTPAIANIVDSAYRNLNENGIFLITCATEPRPPHSGIDGGELRDNEWYCNVDEDYLFDTLLDMAGFLIVKTQVYRDRGDLYVIAHK